MAHEDIELFSRAAAFALADDARNVCPDLISLFNELFTHILAQGVYESRSLDGQVL